MKKSLLHNCFGVLLFLSLIISCKKSDNTAVILDTHTAVTLKNVSFGTDALQCMDNYLPANIKRSRRNAHVACLPPEPFDGAFLLLLVQRTPGEERFCI